MHRAVEDAPSFWRKRLFGTGYLLLQETFRRVVYWWKPPAFSYSTICFLSLRHAIIQKGQSITFLGFTDQEALRDAKLQHTQEHIWVSLGRVALTSNYIEFKEFSIRRRGDGVRQLCATLVHVSAGEVKESNRWKFCAEKLGSLVQEEVLWNAILSFLYVHGTVHRSSMSINVQHDATIHSFSNLTLWRRNYFL